MLDDDLDQRLVALIAALVVLSVALAADARLALLYHRLRGAALPRHLHGRV